MKRNRGIRRAAVLALVLAVLACTAALAASVPDPTADFYVNDYAGVLSDSTKSNIVEKNDGLYAATGAQIVVAVIRDTGGVSMAQYAYDLANDWGIGSTEKNNGVLLLLSIGDDDYQCIQGSGLESLLPTTTLSRILQEELEPDFAAKDYDAGVQKTFDALYDEVCGIYGYDGTRAPAAGAQQRPEREDAPAESDDGFDIVGMLVFLVLVIILLNVLSNSRRRRKAVTPTYYSSYNNSSRSSGASFGTGLILGSMLGGSRARRRTPPPPPPPGVWGGRPSQPPASGPRPSSPPRSGGFGSTPSRGSGSFGSSSPRGGGGSFGSSSPRSSGGSFGSSSSRSSGSFGSSSSRSGGSFGSSSRSGSFGSSSRSGGSFGSSSRSGGASRGGGGGSFRGGGAGRGH